MRGVSRPSGATPLLGHANPTGDRTAGEAPHQNGVTAQGDGLAWQSGIIPTTFCGGEL